MTEYDFKALYVIPLILLALAFNIREILILIWIIAAGQVK